MFWSKKSGRKVCNSIKNIKKDLENLSDLEEKRSKVLAVVDIVKKNLGEVKEEILARAEEDKSLPYIDSQFDSQIDSLAAAEIVEVDKFLSSLSDFVELFEASESHDDLDTVVEGLLDEEKAIEDRESSHAAQLRSMEVTTAKARFHRSDNIPPLCSSDGVSWRRIIDVCTQLGGWYEATKRGRHKGAIIFPSSTRPVPLSEDLSSTNLAKQVRKQLINFLPEHKIPNNRNLRVAFVRGDLHT